MVLRSVMVALLTLASARAFAQDGLDRVRQLYASADYEGAIAELDRLPAAVQDEQLERERYRAMTLIALGRTPEAHAAIERIVLANPRYELSDEEAAPRIRLAFHEVRQRVLPLMVRSLYSEGKAAFDRKELEEASSAFERALATIDLMPAGEPGMADLRTLSAGFLALSRAAAAAAAPAPTGTAGTTPVPAPAATSGTSAASAVATDAPTSESPAPASEPTSPSAAPSAPPASADTPAPTSPPAPASPAAPAPAAPASSAAASSAAPSSAPMTMTEPTALRQVLPPWKPGRNGQQPVFSGIIEVDIDEKGDVSAARMINAVHPSYDPFLLAAARDWKYDPARRGGLPVKSSKRVSVVLHSY